ncbi:MAG: hypothetical protein AB7V62_03245 [Thermoleophilia bacterium]
MPAFSTRHAISAALAVAALGAVAALPATAADPPRLIKVHSKPTVTCVPAAGNTVRAEVRLWMRVVNYDGRGDWASNMEARARLEATTPGISPHTPWVKQKTPYLTQNKKHTYNFKLLTDNKSATAAWQVHVRLIWHRPWPVKDKTENIVLPFNTWCAPVTGGGGTGPVG